MMKKANLKYLVPNGITFLSLSFGVGAILTAIQKSLLVSGGMIFVCYWLDMMDGYWARRLNAQSRFGLQLDSLSDMVALGVGPAILVFQHLQIQGLSIVWVIPLVIFYTMAGAFRLARFNTLPPKTTSSMDSVGLTITQSGCTVTLAVLADSVHVAGFLPVLSYFPLMFLLAVLMVSRIRFPPSSWFFRKHKFGWFLLIFFPFLMFLLHIISTWFIYYLVYILISTGRAIFQKIKPGLQT